jgi:hypothetical protein
MIVNIVRNEVDSVYKFERPSQDIYVDKRKVVDLNNPDQHERKRQTIDVLEVRVCYFY